ncbi:MAG: glycosyltransferase [Bacteroidota bacterium]
MEKKTPRKEQPVSVIICAHNEAENLAKHLPRILNQNYRSFEVVVVNDNSTDRTYDVLLKYQEKYNNLRIVNSGPKPSGMVGKKFPLKIGIQSSQYATLILTDADCCPISSEWLFCMQRRITDTTQIALGYGPYATHPNLLNRFIQFETIYTAIQYFSSALAGEPYMGVGRNLAYRKQLFLNIDGFEKHEHIASGDDDLFISEVATAKNVDIVLEKEAFVFSEPETTWRAYYRQKARHLSTATSYRLRHQILLGFLSFSHFFFYLGGIMLLILKFSIMFVGMVFVVRLLTLQFLYAHILPRFQIRTLLPWIPFLDFMYIFYYLNLIPSLLGIGKKVRWK